MPKSTLEKPVRKVDYEDMCLDTIARQLWRFMDWQLGRCKDLAHNSYAILRRVQEARRLVISGHNISARRYFLQQADMGFVRCCTH